MENDVLTFLFERKVLKRKDTGTLYIYLPLTVVRGKEYDFSGTKTVSVPTQNVRIISTGENDNYNEAEDTFEFCFIDDINTMSEQYVYGFSVIVDNQTPEQIKKLHTWMKQDIEEIRKHALFHTYTDNDGWYKFFVSINDLNINIDPTNYYELQDLLYGVLDELSTDIHEIVEENKERVSIPSYNIVIDNPDRLYSNVIYDKVSQTVICQDEQIRTIAGVLAKNSALANPSLKSNMLICGPTGVGKSEVFRSIHENFGIPVAFEDSNEYTAASYKGKDVTEMLLHLYENADQDIEKAQRGILIIDEIDKKAGSEHETFTSAVINSLLKMMEGHVYNINTNPHGMGGKEIEFDTSLLTFAFLGAFSGIENLSTKKRSLGFMTEEQKEEQLKKENIYTEDTLKKYGLLPEFLGRCDTIVSMNDLSYDDLIKIMKTSNKSQLLLYKNLFDNMGITFMYDDKVIEAIARKAIELKRGARSIKKIVERALAEVNYEIFSNNHYSKLIISPETIEDNKQYILK